jgi:hypothetical protein
MKLSENIKKFLRKEFNFKNANSIKKKYGVTDSEIAYQKLYKDYKKEIINLKVTEANEIFREKVKKAVKDKLEKMQNKMKIVGEKFNYKNYDSDEIVKNYYNTLLKYKNKPVIIEITSNKKLIKQYSFNIPTNFASWWKKEGIYSIYETSDTTVFDKYPNCLIYIYEGENKISTKKIIQYFKEGNINCLLKPINEWALTCLNNCKSDSSKKKYNSIINKINNLFIEIGNNGVNENNIEQISNDLQIDITIEKPIIIENDKYYLEAKSSKKRLKHFIFRNTKINHVDLNELTYLNNIEIVDKDELYEIKNKLDEDNIYYDFKKNLDGISSISTLEKTYQLNDNFYEMCNDFEIETGLNECYIDDIDDKELSEFIKYGTHYNSTVDFKDNKLFDIDSIDHIDMENAYANYKCCKYYIGFLGKITDFRKTNKEEGVGLYQINNIVLSNEIKLLNYKLKIFIDNQIYTSAELKFLKNHNCKFDIIYGCWGINPLDFDMLDFDDMLEKYDGIKGYSKYVGKCDSHHLDNKYWCKGDELLSQTLNNVTYYKNNSICLSYPKKHNYHLGHFTAFITAYQRLQVLEQLLDMDYGGIIRVCVDGIYFNGIYNTIHDCFRFKENKTFKNMAGDSYISNYDNNKIDWNCGEYKINNFKELHIGPGGNGKTHKNLLDNGIVKLLYIAPTWKLATNKSKEYNCKTEVWANLLNDDIEKWGKIRRFYNTLLFDEVSMMTEKQKYLIFERF